MYLLILVHGGESARVAGLATLAGDVFDFFLGAVGEVAGVGVGGHFDGCVGDVWNVVYAVNCLR